MVIVLRQFILSARGANRILEVAVMKTIEAIKIKIAGAAAVVLTLIALVGYMGYRVQRETPGTSAWKRAESRALGRIALWPESPRLLGRLLIERFGPPNIVNQEVLIWTGQYPWKRIIVRQTQTDPLEHVVDYDVAAEKVELVSELDHSIQVDSWKGEISARSDREQLNFLALNLAEEIAAGRRTPEQARNFYVKTANLAAAGKSSPYMDGLMFKPHPRTEPDWKGRAFHGDGF